VAGIATDARANLAGVNVVSVGPLVAEQEPGGVQYSVVVIVPNKTGNDFGSSYVMFDIAQDPFMATVYRTALIIALEEFFGWVQIFDARQILPKRVAKRAHGSGRRRAHARALDQLIPTRRRCSFVSVILGCRWQRGGKEHDAI
jgi:hypothetical protein